MRLYLNPYLLIGGFYLVTASGRIGLSDGIVMCKVAQGIAKQGSVSSEPRNPTWHFAEFQELG